MDDSDRSREAPSPPEDDSDTDDGTVDSADDGADAVESEPASEVDSSAAPETDSGVASPADAEEAADTEEAAGTADSAESAAVDSDTEHPDEDENENTTENEAVAGEAGADADDEEADGAYVDDAEADDVDAHDVEADDDEIADEDPIDAFDAHEPGSAESLGDGGAPATVDDAADAATIEDGDAGDPPADDEAFEGIEGPETDEEMPLAAHIEEMMRRLAIVFLFGGLATLVVVTESTTLINYFWNYHIPAPAENRPRLYGPLELPLTRLKVAGIAGVVVGLPAFVYQTYRFMKPGLYEHERRYYLAAVPTSLVLGAIGVAFAHFLVLPAIFSYFTTYTADAATIAFGLAETFNLIVIMLAFMAIVFQIPLFIMLAIMMNLVTREWLEAKRLIFWGAFLGIAFLFSPDPTGMAPIIVTLTMIVLFEGTLAILRWTGN